MPHEEVANYAGIPACNDYVNCTNSEIKLFRHRKLELSSIPKARKLRNMVAHGNGREGAFFHSIVSFARNRMPKVVDQLQKPVVSPRGNLKPKPCFFTYLCDCVAVARGGNCLMHLSQLGDELIFGRTSPQRRVPGPSQLV